jgi:hypothetical protein
MMKRSVLTILGGLVVSLVTLVSGGSGVAWAKGKTLWSGKCLLNLLVV